MGVLRNRLFWLSLFGILVSGGLLLAGLGYVALVVYTGLVSGTPIVTILLDLAVPLLGGVAALFVGFSLSCIGLLWVSVKHASLPRSDRLGRTAERLERRYPPLRMLGVADLLSPPEPTAEERAEQALADLKQQYVAGEISEAEFERKVDRLVANDSLDEARAAREREQVRDDGR
jgi:hypothetical protein